MLQNFESDLTMRKRGRPEVEALSKDKTVISSDTRAHDHDLKVLDIINASNKGINFIQLKESIIADPYPGYPANKMTPNEINLAILRLSEQGKIEKKRTRCGELSVKSLCHMDSISTAITSENYIDDGERNKVVESSVQV